MNGEPAAAAIVVREATPADIPLILELIAGLAEYERLVHEAVATPADLDRALFGPRPAAEVLIAECDGPFKHALDRCKYPERHPDTSLEAQRNKASGWLVQLDTRLAATGHLLGHHGTVADMAIAPFVRQFAAIDSGWWAAQPWPHLQAWLARWLASPLLEQCMQKYPAWQEGAPGVPFPAPPPVASQP